MIATFGLIALAAIVGLIVGTVAIGLAMAWLIAWLFNHATKEL